MQSASKRPRTAVEKRAAFNENSDLRKRPSNFNRSNCFANDAGNHMTGQNWTSKDVEYLIIEAAQTLSRCESVLAPIGAKPSLWREYADGYGKERTKIRLTASSSALSRMEAAWSLINALDSEKIRKALYGWAQAKASSRSITKVADREGVPRSTIYRRVAVGCSQIADNLNKKHVLALTALQNRSISGINSLHSKNYAKRRTRRNPRHWMAPGAKPVVTAEIRQQRALAAKTANPSREAERADQG